MIPNKVFQIIHFIKDKAIIQLYFYADESEVKKEVDALNDVLLKRKLLMNGTPMYHYRGVDMQF